MTLSKKLIFSILLLLISLVLVAGVSLWGLRGLAGNLERTRSEFEISREVYQVSFHIAVAQAMMSQRESDVNKVIDQLQAADEKLADFKISMTDGSIQMAGREQEVMALVKKVRGELAIVRSDLAQQNLYSDMQDRMFILNQLNASLNQLNQVVTQAQVAVKEAQQSAEEQRDQTITAVTTVTLIVFFVSVLLSILLYRGVTRPLARLQAGVRQMAGADFESKLDETGDAEFAELAREFNVMGSELHTLYSELEKQVAEKSREVVQRERLASMGYFAAGVAHEINNPLGVISGHAELSLRKLDRGADRQAIADTEESLLVIRDEAFRCKSIIEKLLDLSRMGDEAQTPLNLNAVVKSVQRMVQGLRKYDDRKLVVELIATEPIVLANEGEMKQVVLNLVVNAFDASGTGDEVSMRVSEETDHYLLEVIDRGKGMDEATLEKIFQPFFTTKKGRAGASGSGLGLSITHAIVQNCGGEISATSDGLGQGSSFSMRLPKIKESSDD